MPHTDQQLEKSAACDTKALEECIPCQELLRRIDEDLAQWDLERAARRKKIVISVSSITAAAAIVAATLFLVLR